jgi:hypothetical protein
MEKTENLDRTTPMAVANAIAHRAFELLKRESPSIMEASHATHKAATDAMMKEIKRLLEETFVVYKASIGGHVAEESMAEAVLKVAAAGAASFRAHSA